MKELISVKDALPNVGDLVLCYRPDAPESNDPVWKIAYFGLHGREGVHGFNCYHQPSHWCSLPAEPERAQ